MSGLPPGIDLTANKQGEVIGAAAITWALATTALVLRLTCRHISKAGFWIDDYLMIPAYIFCSIISWVTMTWMIDYGFGKHIYIQPPTQIPKAVEVFLKNLFIAEVCVTGTIVFAKFSILAFYWRLFSRNTFVRWSVIGLAVIVSMWGIAVFIIVVAQCRPLNGFWDKTIPADCTVDSYKFFYGNSVPNIITDIMMMIAPLPAIWALKLQMRQKISLSAIFLLGIFVTAVSVTRLVYLVGIDILNPDVTWVFIEPQIWTVTELNIAVVCGCLPQLRPLMLWITTGSPTGSSAASSKKSGNSGDSSKRASKPFASKGSNFNTANSAETSVTSGQYSPYAGNTEKTVYADTRPLVGSGQNSMSRGPNAGFVELNDLERAQKEKRESKQGGAWGINVHTDWNVSTSLKSTSVSSGSQDRV